METDLFTPDFKCEPFWWEDAPRPEKQLSDLPAEVDVVVVGAGYTGLHTAIQTARAGLGTLVLDADALGYGCSSRNGGQVSTSIKGSYTELSARWGHTQAIRILKDGINSLEFLDTFIGDEKLECDWARLGRFSGAHNSAAFEASARALQGLPKEVAVDWHMVSRAEQRTEIGSDFYHGGVVYPDHGALHPGKYHDALQQKTTAAGALMCGHTAVTRIERDGSAFVVHTERGSVRAAKVAVATNGYTSQTTPWQRRRVIPIGSYIIATEPLSDAVAHELSPQTRVMSDSRKLVFYYRLSPDKRRMLFGGRVALKETDDTVSAPALHKAMCKIFPQLATTRISHSWHGFVAYTFDTLPHIGEHDGIHYAMGYCGSGVSLASYCGAKMGRNISGQGDAETSFADQRFQTRPFYTGDPWFLAPSVLYYKWRDQLNV